MTSEGLVEMFEGDSADTCNGKISAGVDGGPSGGSSVRRHGSKDPHWCQRKFSPVIPKWGSVAAPLLLDKEGDMLEEAEPDGAQVVGREDRLARVGAGFEFLLPMLLLPTHNPITFLLSLHAGLPQTSLYFLNSASFPWLGLGIAFFRQLHKMMG
jgi:hypothetical protein